MVVVVVVVGGGGGGGSRAMWCWVGAVVISSGRVIVKTSRWKAACSGVGRLMPYWGKLYSNMSSTGYSLVLLLGVTVCLRLICLEKEGCGESVVRSDCICVSIRDKA